MSITILIADDHKIIREGLRNLIQQEHEMEVVAEANNGRMAVDLTQEFSPDVVIMDISMPELNGIEASRQILKANPSVKIVVLSMHCDRRFITELMNIGVSGYLLKDSAFEELSFAIRTVMANKTYLSPEIIEVFKDYIKGKDIVRSTILSSREREVLQLMAEGKNTKEIASRLYVSIKTIETHRHNIMNKLGIFTIAELTKYAVREGITSLEK